MTTFLSPSPKLQFSTTSGVGSGFKLYTYRAGTVIPEPTYTDSTGGTANSNPVIADPNGFFNVWLGTAFNYKFVLHDANDVPIFTVDNIENVENSLNVFIALLASSGGSAQIGFIQAGTGAVARTAQSKMRERVSVLDFGAVSGGSAATNNTAFANAIAYVGTTGYTLYVPAGTYALSQTITASADLHIEGDGASTVLDFSGTVTGGFYCILVQGALTQIQEIASASLGNLTVTFASPPSLVTEDVFVIYDTVDFSWNASRAYYRKGEWCECRNTSGNDAFLTNPLYDSYTPANVDVYKLTSRNVSFRDFKIKGTTVGALLGISLCDKAVVENVYGSHDNNNVLTFDRCYRPTAINCQFYNKATPSADAYGLVIGNSQKVRVLGGNFYAKRHGITLGGSDIVAAVSNRDVRIIGATIDNDITSGVYSADMHGNVEDCFYQDCTIYNGAGWAGKDTGFDGCTITSMFGGIVIYASEVKGGVLSVRNCKMITGGDPSTISRGIIDLGGNGAAISTWTDVLTNVIIENNFLRATALGATFCEVVKYQNFSCPVNVNITINGLVGELNANPVVILRTILASGSALSQSIVVDNISNFPTGSFLHIPNGGAYTNVPQKMMRQTGRVTLTTNNAVSSVLSGPITFRYLYPRTPSGTAIAGGNTAITSVGTIFIDARIRQLLTNTVEVFICTGSLIATLFNGAITPIDVNWSVGIDEV